MPGGRSKDKILEFGGYVESSDDSTSYDEPAYEELTAPATESYDNNSSSATDNNYSEPAASTGSFNSFAGNSGSGNSAATPVKVFYKGRKVAVPGYETSIHACSESAGHYKVTHCGCVKAVLQLNDSKGNAVSYKSADVAAMANGRYAVCFTLADGVDSTGCTAVTSKGDTTYSTKLGISAVTVNGTVVRDLQAEADATATAAAK